MQRYSIGSYPYDVYAVLGVGFLEDLPFGEKAVGVMDEEVGGIIAYASEEVAERIVSALNADCDLHK